MHLAVFAMLLQNCYKRGLCKSHKVRVVISYLSVAESKASPYWIPRYLQTWQSVVEAHHACRLTARFESVSLQTSCAYVAPFEEEALPDPHHLLPARVR